MTAALPILMVAEAPSWAEAATFYLFASIAVAAAVGVIVSGHIIRAAVWLLLALVGVSGLYFLLDAPFLAATQLVVYAGGTLVLVIFGVMLTGRSTLASYPVSPGGWALAIVAGAVLLAGITTAVAAARFSPQPAVASPDAARALGEALLGPYLVAFELASVLLLVVMIGAAFLARPHKTLDDRMNKEAA